MSLTSVGSPLAWIGFIGLVLALLAIDLGLFHRKAHGIGLREATLWSVVWISLAAIFNRGVYHGSS
jgi:tellurite resistance protein TerC